MSAADPRARPARRPRQLVAGRRTDSQPASVVSIADSVAFDLLAGGLTSRRLGTIVRQTAEQTGLTLEASARGLHALVVRDPRLLSAEPTAALEAALTALALFAHVSHVSLWLVDESREGCAARVGAHIPARRLRRIARRTVTGSQDRSGGAASTLRTVTVTRWDRPWGAVIIDVGPRGSARALGYAEETARALSPLLERKLLLTSRLEAAEHLLKAADRRIARLGFDIHDGPLQALALLLAELSAFERQLPTLLPDDGHKRIVERRVADLSMLAVEAAADLRELVLAGHSASRPLRETLEQTVTLLERQVRIAVDLAVKGDIEAATPSQRIVVARVVEEALANIREHSRAAHVGIEVEREDGLLRVRVTDDGCGFDVTRAVRRAARNRRLGLAVMSERTRLLGGRLEIDSRPGGPTVISAFLPAWDSQDGARAGPSFKVA